MLSLKRIMQFNAASCLIFGVLFVVLPSSVAHFLSIETPAPEWLVMMVGGILIVNGLHLIWTATLPLPKKELVLYFSSGDFLWVFGSIILLALQLWITTPYGIIATLAVAIMVGFFGVMQMVKRRAMGGC